MKKKNSSVGLWVTVIILICLVAGFSLRDQGFFTPAPPTQNPPAVGAEQPDDTKAKADAMKSMAAQAPGRKGAVRADDKPGGPPAPTRPQKPVPSPTSTSSQWYAEEAAKDLPK